MKICVRYLNVLTITSFLKIVQWKRTACFYNKINKQITKLMKSNRKKQNIRNKIYINLLSLGYSNEMIQRNLNNYDFSN